MKIPHLHRLLVLAVACVVLGCGPAPGSRAAATPRIYLARHGQTDWDAEHRLQGWTDTHLDATGRAQAARLGERMRSVPLDRVYSSTLSRSRDTAEAARGSAPLESLDGLRERRLGKFEGIRSGVDSLATAEFDRRRNAPDDSLDGGESVNQFFARVRATVLEIVAHHPSGNILIVGHGGTNQQILRALFGLTAAQADSIHQANDELYLIELPQGGSPRLWKSIPPSRLQDL